MIVLPITAQLKHCLPLPVTIVYSIREEPLKKNKTGPRIGRSKLLSSFGVVRKLMCKQSSWDVDSIPGIDFNESDQLMQLMQCPSLPLASEKMWSCQGLHSLVITRIRYTFEKAIMLKAIL